MDENGTYSWPGNQPQKPRKKTDFKRVGRTILVVVGQCVIAWVCALVIRLVGLALGVGL